MPMHKRIFIAAVAATCVTAGATVAEAAVTKGSYAGAFDRGGSVSLTVDENQQLIKVVRKKMKFKCSDGDSFTSKTNKAVGEVDVSSGSFTLKDQDTNEAETFTMKGKFSGSKVTGTYRHTATFNTKNQLTQNGTVSCTTGKLKFTAKRKK